MKKVIFFAIWVGLLLLVPVTILHTTSVSLALKSHAAETNFIQRFFGLTAYIVLFVQLILGAFMGKIIKKLGDWVFNFHVFEGGLVYFIVLLHPIFFMLFNHFVGIGWDPYTVFINACLLCKTPLEYYYTLGMISFWLITATVFAGFFRSGSLWLKTNWRKLHIINYLIFLLVGLHGFLIGTDFRVQPFYSFAVVSYVIVIGIVVFIEIPRVYRNYMKWIRS